MNITISFRDLDTGPFQGPKGVEVSLLVSNICIGFTIDRMPSFSEIRKVIWFREDLVSRLQGWFIFCKVHKALVARKPQI